MTMDELYRDFEARLLADQEIDRIYDDWDQESEADAVLRGWRNYIYDTRRALLND